MSQNPKGNLGKGVPDYLPTFKGGAASPNVGSAADMNKIVKAIWPTQNIQGVHGVKVMRGDKNITIGLDAATIGQLASELDAEGGTSAAQQTPFKVTASSDSFSCTGGLVEMRWRYADTKPNTNPPDQDYMITLVEQIQEIYVVPPVAGVAHSPGNTIYLKSTQDITVNNGLPSFEIVSIAQTPTSLFTEDLSGPQKLEEYFPLYYGYFEGWTQLRTTHIIGEQIPRHRGVFSMYNVYYPGDIVKVDFGGVAREYRQIAYFSEVGLFDAAIWGCDPLGAARPAGCWQRVT